MKKRAVFSAVMTAMLLAALVSAGSAFATPWVGFYVPGVPTNMTALNTLQAQINTRAAVVNFYINDTDAFPATRCSTVAKAGSTPLVTLEFWSTKTGGLSAITNGSNDAYLRTFARSARAFGKPVWLRPLHEMNGNWYPWGATGANSPSQLIAAYRHVHDIFASQGASNVKFVWSPNVDFDVSSYYPGDAYVDYASMDGYNTGAPWRSFSNVFGPTYASIAAVTSKPMFIAETSSVEGGTGKAAWITDMFTQIKTTDTRIIGVCWFDADKGLDWRVATSASSLNAFRAGASGVSLGLTAAPSASALSIRASVRTIRRRHAFKIRGLLAPATGSAVVRVNVKVPGHAASHRLLRTNGAGAWSMSYTPRTRGTYYLRVSYPGSPTRRGAVSRTIRVVVR